MVGIDKHWQNGGNWQTAKKYVVFLLKNYNWLKFHYNFPVKYAIYSTSLNDSDFWVSKSSRDRRTNRHRSLTVTVPFFPKHTKTRFWKSLPWYNRIRNDINAYVYIFCHNYDISCVKFYTGSDMQKTAILLTHMIIIQCTHINFSTIHPFINLIIQVSALSAKNKYQEFYDSTSYPLATKISWWCS